MVIKNIDYVSIVKELTNQIEMLKEEVMSLRIQVDNHRTELYNLRVSKRR